MVRVLLLCVVLLSGALVGCAKEKRFTEPVRLHDLVNADGDDLPDSGITLSPQLLTDGYEAYTLYCASCHGEKGDGKGVAAAGMRPPPRNFVQGQFKFTGTGYGDLPVDSALKRTIRRGLDGTPMLPWDISEHELNAVVAYLKTFSPRWKEEGVKPELEISPDPFVGREADAISLGRRVYHVAMGGAGCNGCHASFEPKDKIAQLYRDATGDELTNFSPGMYEMGLKESLYPVLGNLGRRKGCEIWLDEKPDLESLQLQVNGTAVDRDEKHANGWDLLDAASDAGTAEPFIKPGRGPVAKLGFFGAACELLTKDPTASIASTRNHKVLPPSFLFARVKSSQRVGSMVNVGAYKRAEYTAAMQREDLYRVIGTGIGGAAMPGWKNVLDEQKLWALTYYVQSLITLRGTPEATVLRQSLDLR